MFLNHTLNFRCDTLWSPDVMFAWCSWSIILLLSHFPIIMQFFSPPKYISLLSKNKGYKRMACDLFRRFCFFKNQKILIDQLKGALE